MLDTMVLARILRGILEDPAGEWPIIGPFYNSCMNMDARNKLGAEPAVTILDQVQVRSAFTRTRSRTNSRLVHALTLDHAMCA